VGRLLHRSLQLSVSAQSCISSNLLRFFRLLSTSLLTWSVYRVSGLPLGLLPLIFIPDNNIYGILFSSILLACPNHLNVFLSIWFCVSFTLSYPVICVFLFLSHLVFLSVTLRNFISAACSLLSSLLVHVHASAAYHFKIYFICCNFTFSLSYIYSITNSAKW
jgi:hypothetical protein